MVKLVVLKVGDGDFAQGFPVTLQIGEEGKPPHVEKRGTLPAAREIPHLYAHWQAACSCSGGTRIQVPPQVTNVSYVEDCQTAAQRLEAFLETWFRQSAMRDLQECIQDEVPRDEPARLVLQTQDELLQKLPWHLWNLIERRSHTELALSSAYAPPAPPLNRPVKILAVLGNTEGIDLQQDQALLSQLPDATLTWLKQPQRQDLNEALWNRPWDILFFAGHGLTSAAGGEIAINETETLSLEQLQYALKAAVKNGLKLAIFNSCSGLGLVPHLSEVKLPQMIVMREPVPDTVAQAFLRYFLAAFSKGESLYLSVRKAREQLQGMEADFPCASWLPVLCQNPAEVTLTWPQRRQPSRVLRGAIATASVLLIGALVGTLVGVFDWLSPPPASVTEQLPPSTDTFQDFAAQNDIPLGNWFYGGSTTWAAIRSTVDGKINQAIPGFAINYIQDPVSPPSSGNGIEMLIRGKISFAQSSRPIRDEEYAAAAQRGFQLKQIPVAYDAIAVVVHPQLPISGLTVEQLIDIYVGDITNWQELGGPDLPIQPYTAPFNSGAPTILRTDFFAEGEDFDEAVQQTMTPSEAIQRVGSPENEAEWGGIYLASARNLIGQCAVKPLPIAPSGSDFVAPYAGELVPVENCPNQRNELDEAAIRSGQYPLVRRLFLIAKSGESPDALAGQTYGELLLTAEGQALIRDAGFVPLRSF